MPDEFPKDILEVYPNMRLRDVYIIKDKNNEIAELQIEGFSDDDVETVKKYYEDKEKRLINKNYEAVFNIKEANSELANMKVSEKTSLFLNVERK